MSIRHPYVGKHPSLGDCGGQSYLVISTIKDGVKLSDEDVPQDPEGPGWGWNVKSLEATAAELHPIHQVLGDRRST